MRWPRRRPQGRHAAPVAGRGAPGAIPAQRAASPALPVPSAPAPATAPAPPPAPLSATPPQAAPTDLAVPVDPAPASAALAAADSGVRLGFTDGSVLPLPAGDPSALALQAVAGIMLDGPR